MSVLAFWLAVGQNHVRSLDLHLPRNVKVVELRYNGFFVEPTGAVGIPALDWSKPIRTEGWADGLPLLRRARRVDQPIRLMRLCLKLRLSDGTQILFDDHSRFVQVPSSVEALTTYKGPVYEMKAPDLLALLHYMKSRGVTL